ncbi:hypothetical protein LF252_05400 [Hymenobacter sp. BT728]|nr:hypothetical protein [Hymenobacter pini]
MARRHDEAILPYQRPNP